MSKAQDIALAISARLSVIDTTAGYNTDAGLTIFRGKPGIDDQDAPCIVLVELGDESQAKDGRLSVEHLVTLRFVAEGHIACDPDNPNDAAHLLIADMKRALWGPKEPTLGGLAKALRYTGRIIDPRHPGALSVAAGVEFEVDHHEDLANP